jgi:hypothetical protein
MTVSATFGRYPATRSPGWTPRPCSVPANAPTAARSWAQVRVVVSPDSPTAVTATSAARAGSSPCRSAWAA